MLLLASLSAAALAGSPVPEPPLEPVAEVASLDPRLLQEEPVPADRPLAWPGGPSPAGNLDHDRLRSARTLRTTGVACSIGGVALIPLGIAVWSYEGLWLDELGVGGGIVLLGGLAALAGPVLTMAGGYQARGILVRRGHRPGLGGLEALAWGSYAVTFTGVGGFGYPVAVGASWAWANTMIERAERSLVSDRSQIHVQLAPAWDPRRRRAGLRVDVRFW